MADLLPPAWFVENWNSHPENRGAPYATALDPLVMFAWHLITEQRAQPFKLPLMGC